MLGLLAGVCAASGVGVGADKTVYTTLVLVLVHAGSPVDGTSTVVVTLAVSFMNDSRVPDRRRRRRQQQRQHWCLCLLSRSLDRRHHFFHRLQLDPATAELRYFQCPSL